MFYLLSELTKAIKLQVFLLLLPRLFFQIKKSANKISFFLGKLFLEFSRKSYKKKKQA